MKRIALIDGDVLVYKTAFASEHIIDWGDGWSTLHSDEQEAKSIMDGHLKAITERLEPDEVVIALTCHETPNFRKAIYPNYKENRTAKRKPLVWRAMRDYLLEAHAARIKPNLEADDILGIYATRTASAKTEERVIVSIDKDFKTIPGKLFRLGLGNASDYGEMIDTNDEQADYNFMMQTLMGDATDNYPGCPGVGEKKAALILDLALEKHRHAATSLKDRLKVMWNAVLKAYDDKGFGPEYALTMARCARILRAEDYNFKTNTPKLWEAPL